MSFNSCPLIAYKGMTYGDRQYPSYASILLNGTTLIGYYNNLDVYNPFLILHSTLMHCIIIICGIMMQIGVQTCPMGQFLGASNSSCCGQGTFTQINALPSIGVVPFSYTQMDLTNQCSLGSSCTYLLFFSHFKYCVII